ncbi:MAG: transposase [Tannerellaceae bacterium]|nr:transposase [Tannerellaceae bacterium]
MGKGRNKDLIIARDNALLLRYHYWSNVERLRYDDMLKILSWQEFFISEETIEKIIREKGHLLPELLKQKVEPIKKPRLNKAQRALLTGQSVLPFDL